MKLLNRRDIEEIFTMKDAIEANNEAFKLAVRDKCEAPLRTKIQAPKHNGCFLFMPAFVEELDTAAIKIVNIFPDNAKENKPTAPAQVLLIDGKTGMIEAIIDGTYLTQLRTGAATGAAFAQLARKDAEIGCLIGTGGQAQTQLEAMLVVRDLKEVRVFGLNIEQTKKFVEEMKEKYAAYNTEIIVAESSDEAIDNADLIVCVTSSTKPVFDGSKVKQGATLSCVGSYQYHMQEMDPVILTRASKIYFDLKEMVLEESGDIIQPLEQGIISEKDFTGDLGDLLLGNIVGRESDDEIIVFKTVGIAAQDLVNAYAIYNKAINKKIGLDWE